MKILLTNRAIDARAADFAEQFSVEFGDRPWIMLIVLNGALRWAESICRHLSPVAAEAVVIDTVKIASYCGQDSSRQPLMIAPPSSLLQDRPIVIVEDIVDTGHTINFLYGFLKDKGISDIRVCSMLDKPSRREVEVPIDSVGFEIEDRFVVGYGLDFDGSYRGLDYIGVMESDHGE